MCVRWCEYTYLIMWKCVCGNANARIRWNEYTYSIMWKHVIDNVDMCVRWNGNTYLIMWIYVFDNVDMRVRWICPYAWRNVRCAFHGLFVGILRNVRWTFRWCSQRYRNPFAMFWQTVSSCREPIYRARIYVYTHEMANGNAYSMKWMYIFNNVKTRVWWNEYVHLMMLRCVCGEMDMCIR